MESNVRSPRDFVLGVVALFGAVVTGVLLFFVVPNAGPGPPSLLQILVLIVGAALLFGGLALLANGIQGRKAPS